MCVDVRVVACVLLAVVLKVCCFLLFCFHLVCSRQPVPALSHAKQQQRGGQSHPLLPSLTYAIYRPSASTPGILLRSGYTPDLSRFLHCVIPVARPSLALASVAVGVASVAVAVALVYMAKVADLAFTVPLATKRDCRGRGR